MKTSAIFFPFDLFGSPGTAAGVHLLADELREILADNRRETVLTRARAYTDKIRLREVEFPDLEAYSNWRTRGRQLARTSLRQGEFLLWIAGNHLGVLPVYEELSAQGDKVLIVQFDAHLDIHQFRDCSSDLNHGNFLLHCQGPLPPLINVGHRDLLLPAESIDRYYRQCFSAARMAVDPTDVLRQLRECAAQATHIYLDIDCDVLDPIHFPAVGQSVPFGLTPTTLLTLIEAVWSDRVQGVFLSEFDPARDRDDRSLSTLVWLIEYILLRKCEVGNLLSE